MELNHLIEHYKTVPQVDTQIPKLLTEIQKLDPKRVDNLYRLASLAEQLERKLAGVDEGAEQDLRSWLRSYRSDLAGMQAEHRRRFGAELAEELGKQGIKLKGQYPTLQAGLFVFKANFDKGRCAIWYGPDQEKLAETALDAPKIAASVKKIRAGIGSGLETSVLLEKIRTAYRHTRLDVPSGPVALTALLPQLALGVQSAKFRADPRRGYYREYGRADFSYDLYHLQGAVNLVTATRQQTRKHGDYLWVPTREDVESGGYFATITMEQE